MPTMGASREGANQATLLFFKEIKIEEKKEIYQM
jgi:hypothetical protein